MKKRVKKLALAKETVKSLEAPSFLEVAVGARTGISVCYTNCACPHHG